MWLKWTSTRVANVAASELAKQKSRSSACLGLGLSIQSIQQRYLRPHKNIYLTLAERTCLQAFELHTTSLLALASAEKQLHNYNPGDILLHNTIFNDRTVQAPGKYLHIWPRSSEDETDLKLTW